MSDVKLKFPTEEQPSVYNCVLYTDGSFVRTDNDLLAGFRGSGVHGYFYKIGDKSNTTNRPNKFVITNTGYYDESSFKEKPNHYLVNPSYYIDACFSYVNHGTANTAELEAVVDILTYIWNMVNSSYELVPDNIVIDNIVIRADSQYVIQWMDKLMDKSITGEKYNDDTPNLQTVKDLENILDELTKKNIKIEVIKVTGHSGEVGNDTADTLAKYGRIQSCIRNVFKSIKFRPASKYWSKNDDSRHPFLRYKQLFFTNTLKAPNDEIYYSVMDYATDTEPGKKTHNACFGLIKLKEQQKLIEDAIRVYHEQSYRLSRRSVVSTLNLNNLFSRNTLHYFDMFLDKIFNFDNRGYTLNNLLNDPIVYTINPGGLALQALECMEILYNILNEFKEKDKVKSVRKYINITDKIYKQEKNKKGELVYNTIIPNGTNMIQFDVEVDKFNPTITFDLGKDTLSRNQFKQLEKSIKGVWLVLHPVSDVVYYYYTIVDLGEEGIGIFCNFYSGKVVLTDKMKKKK